MSLTSRIQALTAYANEVTGESDTTLADAVATLAEGYGQGGGGYTVDEIANKTAPSGDIVINVAVNGYAFYQCSNIGKVTMNSSYMGTDAFNGCSMTSFFGKNVTLGVRGISYCINLTTAVVKDVGNNGAISNTSMSIIDIVNGGIVWDSLKGDTALTTIILRKSSIATLGNVNSFNNTPFANGGAGGTIYIPKALYDELGTGSTLDYKSATNWSTIDGYGTITWAPIEGSIYETQYADGTPILM